MSPSRNDDAASSPRRANRATPVNPGAVSGGADERFQEGIAVHAATQSGGIPGGGKAPGVSVSSRALPCVSEFFRAPDDHHSRRTAGALAGRPDRAAGA